MEDKDYIKDLFSQKLGNYEANVNPQLWDKIASQVTIGASAASTVTGVSLFTKWMIGLGVSAVVATTVVIVSNQTSEEPIKTSEPTLTSDVQEKNEETVVSELNNSTQQNTSAEGNSLASNGSTQAPSNTAANGHDASVPVLQLPTTLLIDQDHLVDRRIVVTPPPVVPVVEPGKTSEPEVEKPELPIAPAPEAIEPAVAAEKDYWIEKLPNVFTPNNDMANDVFMINSKGLLDFNIVVMDKTSQVVFTSDDANFKWFGLNKLGEPVADGKYVYFITAKDSKGNLIKEYSTLSITR